MKNAIIGSLCLLVILLPITTWADEPTTPEKDPFATSEAEMFSDSKTVESVEGFKDEGITDKFDRGTLGFSGELKGTAVYSFATENAKKEPSLLYRRDDAYSGIVEGDILFDARWRYGIKFFSDLYLTNTPVKETGMDESLTEAEKDHDAFFREAFGDFNLARTVYFRIGKQTLKWGKGYLWNPTDLISIDHKNFNDIEARREGSYGLKTQIPFGTALNLYSFIDTTDTDDTSESAFAAKVEFLLWGDFEVSFSGWTKKGFRQVYGFDFSGDALDIQWRGELSVSKGGNRHYLVKENGIWQDSYDPDEVITQASWGFTKLFDVGDINDRLNLTCEFLINPKGYDENMLARTPLPLAGGLTLRELFLSSYYDPYYYGKYYAALFVTYARFLGTSDLTLSANAVENLSDESAVIATNLRYQVTFDSALTFTITRYLGSEDGEFTFAGYEGNVQAALSISF
jgi:hypothetical protein